MYNSNLVKKVIDTGYVYTTDYKQAQETFYYLVNEYPLEDFEITYKVKSDVWKIVLKGK